VAVKLHRPGYEHANSLVQDGKFVFDERDDWSEHQPSAEEENAFIAQHGWTEYGRWHLGSDDEEDRETKAHWKFPYGDFAKLHRCGVLAAESRAGQYKYDDIEQAAHRLHEKMSAASPSRAR
jgi:hypothetical protein